jgi:hypothetical protein
MSVARLDDNQEKDPRAGSSGKQISADLRKIARVSPAPYSAGLPPWLKRNAPLNAATHLSLQTENCAEEIELDFPKGNQYRATTGPPNL